MGIAHHSRAAAARGGVAGLHCNAAEAAGGAGVLHDLDEALVAPVRTPGIFHVCSSSFCGAIIMRTRSSRVMSEGAEGAAWEAERSANRAQSDSMRVRARYLHQYFLVSIGPAGQHSVGYFATPRLEQPEASP